MTTITSQIFNELSKTNTEISKMNGEISGVKEEVSKISMCLVEHLAYDKGNRQKIEDMYKIIVTGNGDLPLPETVRKHENWIIEQKEIVKKKLEFGKGVILIFIGQFIAISGSALAIWLGLNK